MSTVSSPKQISFSCASSNLFLLFLKRKLVGGSPAVELWSNKLFCLLGNIYKQNASLGSQDCHPHALLLNRPHESKWDRNIAQTLRTGRKEIRELFWPIFTQIKGRILIRSELGSSSAGHGHLAAIRLMGFSQTHMMMPTSPRAIQFRALPPHSQRLPNLAFSIPVLNLEFKPIQMLYCIHMLFMLTQSRYWGAWGTSKLQQKPARTELNAGDKGRQWALLVFTLRGVKT